MTKPTVAILGASAERSKFGNKSVRAHLQQGYEVYPVNPKGGEIEGLPVFKSLADVPVARLNRISVYLPPAVGLQMLPAIAAKKPREVWFNPGSESDDLLDAAADLHLRTVVGCSILALGRSPAEFPDA